MKLFYEQGDRKRYLFNTFLYCFVGGGSGFVGKALTKRLQKAGYTVIVVTRNAEGKENAISWVSKLYRPITVAFEYVKNQ